MLNLKTKTKETTKNHSVKNNESETDELIELQNNKLLKWFYHSKNPKFLWLKITAIINLIIFCTLLLTISITSTDNLYRLLHVSSSATDDGILGNMIFKIYLILITLIVVIAASLWTAVSFNNKAITTIKDYRFISITLTVLSVNIYGLYFVINEIISTNKLNHHVKTSWLVKFSQQLGIKKWVTFDYVLVALMAGLTITFMYIEENLLPSMPFGGGIGLKYIPLFIISFTTCFLGGWLTGFISALMAILFIPASHILSPWSYLLDYFLPMTTPALIAFLPFKVSNDKSVFTYVNYFLHCFIILSLVYLWQVLSGILFWGQQTGTRIWDGYTIVTYSLIYNFIPVFIFTYPILQAIIPILYRSLGNYYLNKFH